jgi:hypothetical protein
MGRICCAQGYWAYVKSPQRCGPRRRARLKSPKRCGPRRRAFVKKNPQRCGSRRRARTIACSSKGKPSSAWHTIPDDKRLLLPLPIIWRNRGRTTAVFNHLLVGKVRVEGLGPLKVSTTNTNSKRQMQFCRLVAKPGCWEVGVRHMSANV